MQVPHPHPEAEIFFGQRADRTDVDDVAGVLVVDRMARVNVDFVVIAALEDRQLAGMRDLVEKARASRAEHAALLIEHHVGANRNRLALADLFFQREARRLLIVLHVVVLQLALAGLIAHRAIDRMIDEQEFQHRFLRGLGLRTLGVHHHALGDFGVARDLQLGRLLDLDQAHPAVADDGQPRMIAVVRDLDADLLGGLDQIEPVGYFDFLAVDGELRHLPFPDS